MKKVAIASDNQKEIARHFGRTRGFVVFTIDNGNIINREYRPNDFTGHALGNEGSHNMTHTHSRIIDVLKDCEAVISMGMGRRLYDDLRSANIRAIITTETDVEKAISSYIRGDIKDNPDTSCSHHDH